METVPTEYFVLIYAIMALPVIAAILVVIALIAVATLYFTNRRKTALKILKISGIVIVTLILFIWLTKSSLGI